MLEVPRSAANAAIHYYSTLAAHHKTDKKEERIVRLRNDFGPRFRGTTNSGVAVGAQPERPIHLRISRWDDLIELDPKACMLMLPRSLHVSVRPSVRPSPHSYFGCCWCCCTFILLSSKAHPPANFARTSTLKHNRSHYHFYSFVWTSREERASKRRVSIYPKMRNPFSVAIACFW